MLPTIPDHKLREAAAEGNLAFLRLVTQATLDAVGGRLDADTMPRLSTGQITLLAYDMFRDELLEGGFVQLIHNGYGPFAFQNPFAKMMRVWGDELVETSPENTLRKFAKLMFDASHLYALYGEAIGRETDEEGFMALYEQFADFDELDDDFVELEEAITADIAAYIDNHLDAFCVISYE